MKDHVGTGILSSLVPVVDIEIPSWLAGISKLLLLSY